MGRKVGLWIDHRKAIIASIGDKGEEMGIVISNAERQLRRTGNLPLKGRAEPEAEPTSRDKERIFANQLNHYYDAVTAAIRDADAIFICGPGEAKGELKKRLVKNKIGKRIAAIATVDKLTDRQLAAKVRAFYAEE
jgi:stalled ribosome rescue protein Dom34